MLRGVDVGAKRGQVPQLRQQTSEGLAARQQTSLCPDKLGPPVSPGPSPALAEPGRGQAPAAATHTSLWWV